MTQYRQLEQLSLWAAAKNGQPFDPDTLESAVNDFAFHSPWLYPVCFCYPRDMVSHNPRHRHRNLCR